MDSNFRFPVRKRRFPLRKGETGDGEHKRRLEPRPSAEPIPAEPAPVADLPQKSGPYTEHAGGSPVGCFCF
jgi:hypothetical protein